MNKRQLSIWAMSMLIVGLMITSSFVITAEETESIKIGENLEIKQMKSKYSAAPQTLVKSKATNAICSSDQTYQQLGVDIPVMEFGDVDVLNPTLLTDGGANVLLGAEVYETAMDSNIHFRSSIDGGQTWLPEDGTIYFDLAGAGLLPEKPAIDSSGDLGGFGSVIDINQMGLPQFDFDDIIDYEAGNGWTVLTWNVEDPVDSVDAAGWNSQYSPNAQWSKGLIAFTGDISGTTNVLYMLWANSETGGTGIWTGAADADYEWESLKADNDLTTGMHWEAYEITSNHGDFADGVEIDWIQLDGTDDWWQNNEWSGTLIEGASSPDIDAANGKAYCVFEYNGGIVCAYSNNNGGSIQTVDIASSGSNPHVSIAGDSIIVTYINNGNLIASISENSGMSWEEMTINDDSGTVEDDTHSSCVAGSYIAWTHEGSEYTSIYFDSAGVDVPVIEIQSVSGGVGVTVNVENSGTADAVDIDYTITASGGLLGMINKEATGTVSIAAGGSQSLSLPMIIGLGSVTIDIQVGSASETVTGTQLLFFTML